MIPLLLLIGLILFVVLGVRHYLRTAPPDVARKFRRGLWLFGLLCLVLLAAGGRLAVLIPLLGALIAGILRLLPLLLPVLLPLWQRSRRSRPASATGQSEATARFLRLQLDHESGEIRGEVLAGRYTGRQLSELNRRQLAELYAECRAGDQESATLLRAYLERVHGESWRDFEQGEPASPASGRMSAEEAYEVLGLNPGAGQAEIIAAHRRLMQKLHPDRGGSDYLAAKINQAKDVLLAKG